MILLDQATWQDIAEEIFDDSAGPLDDPPFRVEQDAGLIVLIFDDAREETFFRLRWLM